MQIFDAEPFPISAEAQATLHPMPMSYADIKTSPNKTLVTLIGIVQEVK